MDYSQLASDGRRFGVPMRGSLIGRQNKVEGRQAPAQPGTTSRKGDEKQRGEGKKGDKTLSVCQR